MIYLYGILIFLIFIFNILFFSGFYFYNKAIKRNKKSFLKEESFIDNINKNLSEDLNWLKEQSKESVQIESFDGLKLNGKLLYAKNTTNNVIILVHGYSSSGDDLADFAHLFYDKYGFNVLIPDLRGHGKSEGHYIGLGYHDHFDIINWIQYVVRHFGQDAKIALLGVSMGGAAVCMVSGEKLPKNVKFIISDCAYDSIYNILAYQCKRMYKIPKFPILNITNLFTKKFAKYNINDGKVYEKVKKSQIPILFIHGEKDDYVPTYMVYNLYKNAKCEKKLLIVPEAGHAEAYDTDPIAYQQAIDSFIESYL